MKPQTQANIISTVFLIIVVTFLLVPRVLKAAPKICDLADGTLCVFTCAPPTTHSDGTPLDRTLIVGYQWFVGQVASPATVPPFFRLEQDTVECSKTLDVSTLPLGFNYVYAKAVGDSVVWEASGATVWWSGASNVLEFEVVDTTKKPLPPPSPPTLSQDLACTGRGADYETMAASIVRFGRQAA